VKHIEGYCYVTHQPVTLSRQEWQERILKTLKAEGHRRVEAGETFIHNKDGRMLAEIYANVNVTSEQIYDSHAEAAQRIARGVTAALSREPRA
jgi:hypothetical protein